MSGAPLLIVDGRKNKQPLSYDIYAFIYMYFITIYHTEFLSISNDARHKKTDLKVFVDVIPKEGLAGWGPRQSFFGYDTDYRI